MKYAPRKVYIKESGKYVELSYIDFCRRRQADQSYMDKLFIPIQGCLIEVVREQYADFYKEKERWRYLKKLDTNHKLLSLEGFTDSEGNVIDFVIDETVDVAETVVRAVLVDRLKAALPLLSDSEQTLVSDTKHTVMKRSACCDILYQNIHFLFILCSLSRQLSGNVSDQGRYASSNSGWFR